MSEKGTTRRGGCRKDATGETTHRYGYKKNEKTLLGYVHYNEQKELIRRTKTPARQQLNDEGNSDDEEQKGGKR
jgi:hypothetical protein